MQHSANYLRAYPEIHARVSGVHQAPSFKRRTLAAWGHLPRRVRHSVRFGPTPVGVCRRRIDPGYPKPFSDASF